MKKKTLFFILSIAIISLLVTCSKDDEEATIDTIIDHRCTDLSKIPQDAIVRARQDLHIAYWHSYVGGQIVYGMQGLINFKGTLYDFSNDELDSVLHLVDNLRGANDLGNPDNTAWEATTLAFLDTNDNFNVVIWAWGGQVSDANSQEIDQYLNLMSALEADYPEITFVYMTGMLDGTSLEDNLYLRNEQIRKYCRDNNKLLYDFADIESYNPDGEYFGDKLVDENCDYDSDGDGIRDSNWATEWQNSHLEGIDWYYCNAPATQPLNANLKAYAAWWLWARIAGWEGR